MVPRHWVEPLILWMDYYILVQYEIYLFQNFDVMVEHIDLLDRAYTLADILARASCFDLMLLLVLANNHLVSLLKMKDKTDFHSNPKSITFMDLFVEND